MSPPLCPHCRAPVTLGAGHERCSACQALIFRPGTGPCIVVGHADDAVCIEIGSMLQAASYTVICGRQGADVWHLYNAGSPAALVLDVTLEEPSAFALIEQVRAEARGAAVKIVVVAQVHSQTAYKRPPTRFYGADEYVERHRLHELLVPKLKALLQGQATAPPVVRPAAQEPVPGVFPVDVRPPLPALAELLRVRALASSIIADLTLSHQAEVEAVVRGSGSESLTTALQDGRRLLASMTKDPPGTQDDPIAEAFDAFIQQMRQQLRRFDP